MSVHISVLHHSVTLGKKPTYPWSIQTKETEVLNTAAEHFSENNQILSKTRSVALHHLWSAQVVCRCNKYEGNKCFFSNNLYAYYGTLLQKHKMQRQTQRQMLHNWTSSVQHWLVSRHKGVITPPCFCSGKWNDDALKSRAASLWKSKADLENIVCIHTREHWMK